MWFCAQCQLKPGLKPSGLGLFCRAGFFPDVSTALRLCFECQIFHSWPCSQLLWVSTHSLGLRKLERSKYICPRVLTGILGPVSASTLICFLIMILVIQSCFSDLFFHLQFEGIFILHAKCQVSELCILFFSWVFFVVVKSEAIYFAKEQRIDKCYYILRAYQGLTFEEREGEPLFCRNLREI